MIAPKRYPDHDLLTLSSALCVIVSAALHQVREGTSGSYGDEPEHGLALRVPHRGARRGVRDDLVGQARGASALTEPLPKSLRRSRLAKRLRRVGAGLIGCFGLLVIAAILTASPGDPALYPPAGDAETIHLVSHGWHSGIVLPRESLTGEGAGAALRNVAMRFRDYPQIEFGWGEARFYRATPTLAQFDARLALEALFTPGGREGVVQVVGLKRDVRASFPHSDIVPVRVSRAGVAKLLARLDASFRLEDGHPVAGGPGLYGPSLFYAGKGRFSALNVCNHWAARLLNAAGLPITPILDTHPAGLLADLRWRAGLRLLQPTGIADSADPNLSKP